MRHLNLLTITSALFLSHSLFATTSPLGAIVYCPAVAPGGTAQIAISFASPEAITAGSFSIDLDPTVFGSITAVHVFSATGDQQGLAVVKNLHADVQFGSNTGGIGRLPGIPFAEITASVLPTAPNLSIGKVTVSSSSTWHQVSGLLYNLSFASSGVPVGPNLSIQSVAPGSGAIPAGTLVTITGQGFTPTTQLTLSGVPWANLQFVNSSMLTFTVTGATDLFGKFFQLADAKNNAAQYLSALTPLSLTDETNHSGYWPIFPSATLTNTSTGSQYPWFENDSPQPVNVVLSPYPTICTPCAGEPLIMSKTVTVPPWSTYLSEYLYSTSKYPVSGVIIQANGPIRVLSGTYSTLVNVTSTPASLSLGFGSNCVAEATVDYRLGDAAPAPLTFAPGNSIATVTTGTDDGNPWFQATFTPGSNSATLSFAPQGLGLGPHLALLKVTYPTSRPSLCYTYTLNVNPGPLISTSASGFPFEFLYFSYLNPVPISFQVVSNSPVVPVTLTSSSPDVVLSPTSGATPLQVTAQLAPGTPPFVTSSVTIQSPGNTIQIHAEIDGPSQSLFLDQPAVTVAAIAGSTQPVSASLLGQFSFTIGNPTTTGGNWLTATVTSPNQYSELWTLSIQADPSGLAPGTYTGSLTATPIAGYYTPDPVQIKVTFEVLASPPPITLSPQPIEIVPGVTPGEVTLSTGQLSLPFTVSTTSDPSGVFAANSNGLTPTTILLVEGSAYPGTYSGTLTVTSPPNTTNSLTVPVTVTQPPNPVLGSVPLLSSLVNAASLTTGPIAPGEIVSLFGLFPIAGAATLHLGSDGKANRNLFATQVLFNGVPAPLTYVSPLQINAVVPYEIAGSSLATVQVGAFGILSDPRAFPIAATNPALFTQDGTGQNAAAVLNQDNSLNTTHNPARKGSIVQIFLTGEGMTSPPGITGEITGTDLKTPLQPVNVQIGGVSAKVLSATSAPGSISGLFQINAVVPTNIFSGSAPISIQIGSATSQPGTTVSVQ